MYILSARLSELSADDIHCRFVHEQCLNEWLNVRKKAIPSCELCGAALVFAQGVYRP